MHTSRYVVSFGVFVTTFLLASFVFFQPIPARAASLTEAQIQSILTLLTSFGADSATVTSVNAALRGQTSTTTPNPSATAVCLSLTHALYRGVSDSTTNGEVTKLQKFLGLSSITGYFGPLTESAVQTWQRQNGVVSSGTAQSTGYGYVGAQTRATFARGCTQAQLQKPIDVPRVIETSGLTIALNETGVIKVADGKYRGLRIDSIGITSVTVRLEDTGQTVTLEVGSEYLFTDFKLALKSIGTNQATFQVTPK